MEPVEIALNLESDLTEREANELALRIIQRKDITRDVISKWIEDCFDENKEYVDRLIDVIYELTSKESDDMVRRLMQKAKNENVKGCLLEVFSYRCT